MKKNKPAEDKVKILQETVFKEFEMLEREQKIDKLIEKIKAKGFYDVDENNLAYYVVCYTIQGKEFAEIKKIEPNKISEYAESLADEIKDKVYHETELHNIIIVTLEENDRMLWEREPLHCNNTTDKEELSALKTINLKTIKDDTDIFF